MGVVSVGVKPCIERGRAAIESVKDNCRPRVATADDSDHVAPLFSCNVTGRKEGDELVAATSSTQTQRKPVILFFRGEFLASPRKNPEY